MTTAHQNHNYNYNNYNSNDNNNNEVDDDDDDYCHQRHSFQILSRHATVAKQLIDYNSAHVVPSQRTTADETKPSENEGRAV